MNDYSKWTVMKLKSELQSRNLDTQGKKADLIERLETHTKSITDENNITDSAISTSTDLQHEEKTGENDEAVDAERDDEGADEENEEREIEDEEEETEEPEMELQAPMEEGYELGMNDNSSEPGHPDELDWGDGVVVVDADMDGQESESEAADKEVVDEKSVVSSTGVENGADANKAKCQDDSISGVSVKSDADDKDVAEAAADTTHVSEEGKDNKAGDTDKDKKPASSKIVKKTVRETPIIIGANNPVEDIQELLLHHSVDIESDDIEILNNELVSAATKQSQALDIKINHVASDTPVLQIQILFSTREKAKEFTSAMTGLESVKHVHHLQDPCSGKFRNGDLIWGSRHVHQALKKLTYMKKIPAETTESSLEEAYPDATHVWLPINAEGKNKGYAYIEYTSEEKAREVVKTDKSLVHFNDQTRKETNAQEYSKYLAEKRTKLKAEIRELQLKLRNDKLDQKVIKTTKLKINDLTRRTLALTREINTQNRLRFQSQRQLQKERGYKVSTRPASSFTRSSNPSHSKYDRRREGFRSGRTPSPKRYRESRYGSRSGDGSQQSWMRNLQSLMGAMSPSVLNMVSNMQQLQGMVAAGNLGQMTNNIMGGSSRETSSSVPSLISARRGGSSAGRTSMRGYSRGRPSVYGSRGLSRGSSLARRSFSSRSSYFEKKPLMRSSERSSVTQRTSPRGPRTPPSDSRNYEKGDLDRHRSYDGRSHPSYASSSGRSSHQISHHSASSSHRSRHSSDERPVSREHRTSYHKSDSSMTSPRYEKSFTSSSSYGHPSSRGVQSSRDHASSSFSSERAYHSTSRSGSNVYSRDSTGASNKTQDGKMFNLLMGINKAVRESKQSDNPSFGRSTNAYSSTDMISDQAPRTTNYRTSTEYRSTPSYRHSTSNGGRLAPDSSYRTPSSATGSVGNYLSSGSSYETGRSYRSGNESGGYHSTSSSGSRVPSGHHPSGGAYSSGSSSDYRPSSSGSLGHVVANYRGGTAHSSVSTRRTKPSATSRYTKMPARGSLAARRGSRGGGRIS